MKKMPRVQAGQYVVLVLVRVLIQNQLVAQILKKSNIWAVQG